VTESVPGYRNLTRIGHGGFSVVYRAVQESFDRDVALKVLTVVGPDEDARRRFRREIQLAGKLSGHPHVVTVLDTGTTGSGRPYLAMDLYEGGSMKQRLGRSGPLSAAETAVVGAKIAEALAAAHALGVLHRDVKPNNILVSRFGEPALADFGVSCLLDSSSSASVLDVFSPQHAAPELMTRGVPSQSSDVYALGSTMYELLIGHSPFGGEGRDVRSIMWRTLSEPAPRPDCPDLPELADAIVRALAKEPADRFADAADFAKTLRALIPEGTPSVLAMPELPESSATMSDLAATALVEPETYVGGESSAEPVVGVDATGAGRPPASDETMVRPDRADPVPVRSGRPPRGGGDRGGRADRVDRGGGDGERDGRRVRRSLIVVGTVVLVGLIAWAVIETQSPSAAPQAEAAVHHSATATSRITPTPTRSASNRPTQSSASPKTSPSITPSTVKTTASAPASTGPSASASKSTPTQTSSSAGLSILDTYQRLKNEQSGNCLAEPGGGSSAAQQACASGGAEGWSYASVLSGILGAVSPDVELVNQQSGDCLSAGSGGQVSAAACNGGSGQTWQKTASGSGFEFRDEGTGQCLYASGGGVTAGSCGSSDAADLWTEDGTG
jgi:serine/threonine protein kinase